MKKKDFGQDGAAVDCQMQLEDEFFRRRKVISIYVRATGSQVTMLDGDLRQVGRTLTPEGKHDVEQEICEYCGFGADGRCRKLHAEKIADAGRQGKAITYRCDLALSFWVSPIYRDGRLSGALRGSGLASGESSSCGASSNGGIPSGEFEGRVRSLAVGDEDKVRSLSEMLLICADSFSQGTANHHEEIRLRYEQRNSLSSLIDDLRKKHPEGPGTLGYPLEKERDLIAALRQGNKAEASETLNRILAVLVFSSNDNFPYLQIRAMELVVLIARTGTSLTSASTVDTNARFLKRIQEAKIGEDLTAILHDVVQAVCDQVISFHGLPHASAMRKAELYIRENLGRKISLGEIAAVAGLSAPYFSTIFKEEMGENLSGYVNRQRVEKASRLLLESDLPLSEIATICCFQDQSWFSKIFKTFTGVSPGKYRRQGGLASNLHSHVGEK